MTRTNLLRRQTLYRSAAWAETPPPAGMHPVRDQTCHTAKAEFRTGRSHLTMEVRKVCAVCLKDSAKAWPALSGLGHSPWMERISPPAPVFSEPLACLLHAMNDALGVNLVEWLLAVGPSY